MVLLPPHTIAFFYQAGLDRIGDAFRASMAALGEHRAAAGEAADRYRAEGADDSRYEQDGDARILVHSTQHTLDHALLEASLSLSIIREAFVISAFHYWEGWARSLTHLNEPRQHYGDLKTAMAKRYPVHNELDTANLLANLLKHGSGAFRHARTLAGARPDLFSRLPTLYGDWALALSDDDVFAVLGIVKASGPAIGWIVRDDDDSDDRRVGWRANTGVAGAASGGGAAGSGGRGPARL